MSIIFFFFSSRRRHTRSLCDWSSDVCSSDLHRAPQHRARALVPWRPGRRAGAPGTRGDPARGARGVRGRLPGDALRRDAAARGAHAHARRRPRDPPDGRALRRARHPHQAHSPRGALERVGGAPPDGRLRHPRPLGGDHARRPDHRHDAPAWPGETRPRRGHPAAPRRDQAARDRGVRARVQRDLARAGRRARGVSRVSERAWVLCWRLLILVVLVGAWEWLTGIKAISTTPGLYWIDPFFVSRPSVILRRFAYLASGAVRLSIWAMALSTVQSTLWGFVVGVSTGFAAGLVLGRRDRLARVFEIGRAHV